MANPEHVKIVKAGKKAIDEWWKNRSTKEIKKHVRFTSRLQTVSFDLSGADLKGLVLHDAKLAHANFIGADLAKADFSGSDLSDASLDRLDLRQVNFTKSCLNSANMNHADLERQLFLETNLDHSDLRSACLRRVHIEDCSMQRASLNYANLRDARIFNSFLDGSFLHYVKLNRARIFGSSLYACRMGKVDFRRAFLCGVILSKAGLWYADLRDAVLRDVQLYRTILNDAKLDGIDFDGILTDNWQIDNVSCTHFFSGASLYPKTRSKRRIPSNGYLQAGEFEDRFKSRPTIEFVFEQGLGALDPAALDAAIYYINTKQPKLGLRLLSIDSRGGLPRAIIEIAEKVSKDDALQLVSSCYQQKIHQLKSEIQALAKDKSSLLQIVSQKVLLPAMEDAISKKREAKKRGRPPKYTKQQAKKLWDMHEKIYQDTNDSYGAWSKVADFYDLPSGKAAEQVCRRYLKQNK